MFAFRNGLTVRFAHAYIGVVTHFISNNPTTKDAAPIQETASTSFINSEYFSSSSSRNVMPVALPQQLQSDTALELCSISLEQSLAQPS